MEGVHEFEIEVDSSSIDENGHVNNVEFVRWMQDAATRHADAVGCTAATRDAGATWVVRSHRIDYLRAAFAGDKVRVQTWVADYRRAFSKRGYRFLRAADGAVLAKGETDWVFVDVKSARPRSIPDEVKSLFVLLPSGVDELRM
jgi:acyl-CoA thioester hydrolase